MTGAGLADRPLVHHLCDRARSDADRPAYRAKAMGIWHEVTWAEHRRTVEHVALGLQALGVERGDRVALLASNRPEWLAVDLAVQSLGAAVVGLYPTTPDRELCDLLARTAPKVLVAGDAADVPRLVAGGRDGVEAVVVFDAVGRADADQPAVVAYAELVERGAAVSASDASAWERAVAEASADDVVAICCTPGTTGVPKAVALSSREVVAGIAACLERVGAPGVRDRTVVRLPLAHLCERQLAVYSGLLHGCVTHLPEDDVTVGEATLEVQPTLLAGLPADWTAAAARVDAGVADSGRLARATWRAAMALRKRGQRAQWHGRGAGPHVRVGAWFAYWAICRPVLNKFGYGRLRCAITVNDALPGPTAERWSSWGIALHEAYTLVEGGGFVAVQAAPGGPLGLVAGTEATLGDDGELVLRRPAANHAPPTHEPTALGDGWLRTGDLAQIDADGTVRILGRRSDLVDVDGRTVMATAVEAQLRRSPFVRHAVVAPLGGGRLGALVEPDARAVLDWARRQGLGLTGYGALLAVEQVQQLLAEEVATANRALEAVGLPGVAVHRLLPQPLDAEGGEELTAVGTVRRASVLDRHRALVEEMGGPVASTVSGGVR